MKPKPVIIVLCFNCLVCVSCHINPACECVVYQSDGGSQGTFTSPNFPQIYPSNIDCILYTFIGALDEIVELTFLEFNLSLPHNSSRCQDYVRFYLDLERPEVSAANKFNYEECGNISMIEKKHYSSDRSLIFEFHTDRYQGNNTGFRGKFKFLNRTLFDTVGCKSRWGTPCVYDCRSNNNNKNTRTQTGIFFSPKYPQNYPPNVHCKYIFYGGPQEKVKINFKNIQLEKIIGSCSSSPDFIIVRDGTDHSSAVIARFCRTMNGQHVTSTGNNLTVEFTSSDMAQRQGFAASFEFIKDPNHPVTPRMITSTPKSSTNLVPSILPPKDDPNKVSSECDSIISSHVYKTGIIKSPGYPMPYKPDINCKYLFRGQGKERVQLEFKDLDLYYIGDPDDPYDCESSDSVDVQIHIDNDDKNLGVYCGRKEPPLLMSNGNNMDIIFKTESQVKHHHRGFEAKYTFVENFGIESGQQLHDMVCGFKFNSSTHPNGTLTSPNYPGLYPRNTECHYLFYGQGAEKVRIKFPYFDVEGIPPSCSETDTESDFIEFSNFDLNLPDRQMPRFCGSKEELSRRQVESDGSFFRVSFKSNDVYDATGFEAFYQFVKIDPEAPGIPRPPENQASSHQDITTFSTLLIIFLVCFSIFG